MGSSQQEVAEKRHVGQADYGGRCPSDGRDGGWLKGDCALSPTPAALIPATSSPSALFLGVHKRPDCLTHTVLCASVMKAQVVLVPWIFWALRGHLKKCVRSPDLVEKRAC